MSELTSAELRQAAKDLAYFVGLMVHSCPGDPVWDAAAKACGAFEETITALVEARQEVSILMQELQAAGRFSGDLERRLEDADGHLSDMSVCLAKSAAALTLAKEETRQEAKRANNAALRAEKNALRVKELEGGIPNPAMLRSMADEVVYSHDYVADKLRQCAKRIEEAQQGWVN